MAKNLLHELRTALLAIGMAAEIALLALLVAKAAMGVSHVSIGAAIAGALCIIVVTALCLLYELDDGGADD